MTLPEFLTANLGRKFQWGDWDCILFAIGWVNIATGKDHLAGIPAWKSEKAAIRIVRKLGGLEQAFDDRFKRIHPNLAKDGDIALCNGRAALFSGSHIVGPGATGFIFLNRTEAECAWSF